MATTKQINQLNNASSISSSDYLALSQSGQSEATKATVEQLANAVGELNSTGALSELCLDVSIGKNLLAQRLAEKGATSTPSDSLITMADKLNNLDITDTSNQILKTIFQEKDSIQSTSTYTAILRLPYNKKVVLYVQGILYYCSMESTATSIDELKQDALFSIDTGFTTDALVAVNASETHVAVEISNVCKLYSIGESSFTLVSTNQLTTAPSGNNKNSIILDDDGSKIAYVSGTDNNGYIITVYDLNLQIESSFTFPLPYTGGYGRIYQGFMGNGKIHYVLTGGSSSSYEQTATAYYGVIRYTDNGDGTVTYVGSDYVSYGYTGYAMLVPINKTKIIYFNSDAYDFNSMPIDNNIGLRYANYRMFLSPSDYVTFKVYLGQSSTATGTSNIGIVPIDFGIYESYNSETDTVVFKHCLLPNEIVINLTTRKVTGTDFTNIYFGWGTTSYANVSGRIGWDFKTICRTPNANSLLVYNRGNDRYAMSTTCNYAYLTKEPQFYGFVRTINGNTIAYTVSNYLSIQDVANGKTSVDTTKIILTEDSEESN